METKRFYVYMHSIDGIVFYVGSSQLRLYKEGGYRTMHERAYLRCKREKVWKDFVNGRDFTVDIVGYYNSKEEVLKVEYDLIHDLLDKPYANLVNKLGTVPVFQFSLIGEFIREWNNVSDAAKSLKINRHSISCCLLGLNKQRTQAGGFLWSYTTDAPKYFKTKIIQKDLEGKIVNVYPSLRHATTALNKNSYTSIKACLAGRYSHAYGFKWEYEANDAAARSKGLKKSKFSIPSKNQKIPVNRKNKAA